MNVIARLEYEFVYYDSAVHRFNHEDTPSKRTVVVLFNTLLKDKEVHTFPKDNVIAWLKIELAKYDVTGQHVSHNAMQKVYKNSYDRIEKVIHLEF